MKKLLSVVALSFCLASQGQNVFLSVNNVKASTGIFQGALNFISLGSSMTFNYLVAPNLTLESSSAKQLPPPKQGGDKGGGGSASISIFPNPVGKVANITVVSTVAYSGKLRLISPNGLVLKEILIAIHSGDNIISLPMLGFPLGFYTVEILGTLIAQASFQKV